MAPLVSVLTPAYKAADWIGLTVRSVLAQTMRDFELLVVDDCSPDGTAEVVGRLAAADSRVRLVRHAQNQGPAAARNTALREASSRFVAFLDADDLWLPEKLNHHLSFMRQRNAAISCTSYRRIDADGNIISGIVGVPDRIDYEGLLRNTALTTSTVVVDRDQTGPFFMRQVYYDDYVCWLELLKRGHVAHGCPEDLTRYRVVGNSWSRNKLRSARQVWRVHRGVERLPLTRAAWVFAQYAWNAYWKYRQ